ncbi:hypothetical protein VTI74DRAFT_11138 [Chaetomium olivicolor]
MAGTGCLQNVADQDGNHIAQTRFPHAACFIWIRHAFCGFDGIRLCRSTLIPFTDIKLSSVQGDIDSAGILMPVSHEAPNCRHRQRNSQVCPPNGESARASRLFMPHDSFTTPAEQELEFTRLPRLLRGSPLNHGESLVKWGQCAARLTNSSHLPAEQSGRGHA